MNNFETFLVSDEASTVYVPHAGFFAKVRLAANLIGILFWNVYTDKGFVKSLFMHSTAPSTLVAFYLPNIQKMFVYRDYAFLFKPIPVEYEEIISPNKAVSEAVTNQLIPYLKKADFDTCNNLLLTFAESSFLYREKRPLQYHVDTLPASIMENGFAEYLENPDAWANKAAKLLIQDESFREKAIKSLQLKKDINDIVEEVEKDASHGWHKKRALLEALAGKATVTVVVRQGTTEKKYKFKTENVPICFDQKGFIGTEKEFSFSDIKKVLYRGAIIFQQ